MKKLIATLVVITFGVSLVSCGSNSLFDFNGSSSSNNIQGLQAAKQYESQLLPYKEILEDLILQKVNEVRKQYWEDYEKKNNTTVAVEKKAPLNFAPELREATRLHSQNIFDHFLLTDPNSKRSNGLTTTPHWDDVDNTTPPDRMRAAYAAAGTSTSLLTRFGENIYCVDILELQYHATLDSFADYFVKGRAHDSTTGWMNSPTHRDTLLDVKGDPQKGWPYLNFTGVGIAIAEYTYLNNPGVWVCTTQNFVHKN